MVGDVVGVVDLWKADTAVRVVVVIVGVSVHVVEFGVLPGMARVSY